MSFVQMPPGKALRSTIGSTQDFFVLLEGWTDTNQKESSISIAEISFDNNKNYIPPKMGAKSRRASWCV